MNASSTETLASPATSAAPSMVGILAATWGVTGVVLLLANAVYRLGPRAWEAARMDLSAGQWTLYAGIVVFFAYTEGYKSFQNAFSPRVVARALHLAYHPVWWHALLAPLFCMGFFHATRKRLIVAWMLTVGIVVLVLLVSQMSMPWRGFIDGGVVVALMWGAVAIVAYAARAAVGIPPGVPPDVPEDG